MIFVLYILDVIRMHILDVILMHTLGVVIQMHILDVLLLLLLPTTVIAPLFWGFQPQSNKGAGSVVVPTTTVLSLPTVLKHKYGNGVAKMTELPDRLPVPIASPIRARAVFCSCSFSHLRDRPKQIQI